MADVKGAVSKSQARAQATRARIISGAYELFCENGFKATTMEIIGERAGIAMREPDAPDALRAIVAGVAAIDARIAPMIPVFHAVAQDPAGVTYRRSEARRHEDMAELASALSKKTPLVKGMTRRRAADLLHFLTGPESYRTLVLGCEWSQQEWIRWAGDTLCRDLFGDGPR